MKTLKLFSRVSLVEADSSKKLFETCAGASSFAACFLHVAIEGFFVAVFDFFVPLCINTVEHSCKVFVGIRGLLKTIAKLARAEAGQVHVHGEAGYQGLLMICR